MMNQRIHQSPSWNPPTQQKSSQLASPSLTVQTQQNSPKSSQEDKEKEAFGQDCYEADRLQLKSEIGTLTSGEQEQLGVLQAKMNDFWVRGRETASQFGHNLANIPVSSPDKQGSALQSKTAIQAKLTIGEPGDKYEREADSVAAEVVNRINSPQVQQQGQAVQRQEEPEEEELQTKPEITSLQRMEEPEEEELQTKPSISDLQKSPSLPEIQREAMPEEEKEDLQAKSILHRKEAIGEASADLESAIHSARGGGQALDAGLQGSMGQAMGADFSGVKVHTDAQSDQLNQSIQARAFTTGRDVFFRQGEYNPGSRGGQELIAHELTHVVQQNGGAVMQSPSRVTSERIMRMEAEGSKENKTVLEWRSEMGRRAITAMGAARSFYDKYVLKWLDMKGEGENNLLSKKKAPTVVGAIVLTDGTVYVGWSGNKNSTPLEFSEEERKIMPEVVLTVGKGKLCFEKRFFVENRENLKGAVTYAILVKGKTTAVGNYIDACENGCEQMMKHYGVMDGRDLMKSSSESQLKTLIDKGQ